jgi:hypothetical protein
MSKVRNRWIEEAIDEHNKFTHLWSVDSDVLPNPGVLDRLISLNKPIVSAYVPIADGITPIHMMGWDRLNNRARRTGDEKRCECPHLVTLVGACVLIRRDVLTGSLTHPYGEHAQGEDGYFGDWCRFQGVEMWVDPAAKCQHIMKES